MKLEPHTALHVEDDSRQRILSTKSDRRLWCGKTAEKLTYRNALLCLTKTHESKKEGHETSVAKDNHDDNTEAVDSNEEDNNEEDRVKEDDKKQEEKEDHKNKSKKEDTDVKGDNELKQKGN